LDLVDRQRKVAIRRKEISNDECEHFLVGGRKQEIVIATIFQPKEVGAVLGPAPGCLVRLSGQKRREVNLLKAGGVHLISNDVFDFSIGDPAEREPREAPRGRPADVPGSNEKSV
jgi:hypothetical protein